MLLLRVVGGCGIVVVSISDRRLFRLHSRKLVRANVFCISFLFKSVADLHLYFVNTTLILYTFVCHKTILFTRYYVVIY